MSAEPKEMLAKLLTQAAYLSGKRLHTSTTIGRERKERTNRETEAERDLTCPSAYKYKRIKDASLPKALLGLEKSYLNKRSKFGIVYVKQGQKAENEIFSNGKGR